MERNRTNTAPGQRKPSTTNWADDGKWKKRYSKLYTVQRRSLLGHATSSKEDTTRISFLSQESAPLFDQQARRSSEWPSDEKAFSTADNAPITPQFQRHSSQSDKLDANSTVLLDMVRAKSISQDAPINYIQEPVKEEVQESAEDEDSCTHSLINLRIPTERSMSRSRVSRISTRRDMDIPSILAYNVDEGVTYSKPHRPLEIPAFKMPTAPVSEPIPRWSIRRSMCPVCSQKWRDKSSIGKIRGSGFKRKSSLDLLSVVAPARLRTSITLKYAPRPAPVASDQEAGVYRGGLRNNSTSWQLARARRFRIPKISLPPEATAPPVFIEPIVRKDLDNRVQKFLKT